MIQLNKKYTRDEIRLMRDDPELAKLQLRGYVLRLDSDGTMSFVHWTRASGGGGLEEGKQVLPLRTFTTVWDTDKGEDPWNLPPLTKRTPQQRIASLTSRWLDGCRKAGTIPGVPEDQVRKILGDGWKTGTSEITVQDVRRLASFMLQDAEAKKKARDDKLIVTPSPNS